MNTYIPNTIQNTGRMSKMEQEKKIIPNQPTEKNKSKKTNAKAAGLKSILITKEGELLMTSYGKGSEAKIEKRISNGTIETVADKPAFQAVLKPVGHFDIRGRDRIATADDPEHRAPEACYTGDLVYTRSALEKRYFNKTFQDNIHIQLIHNILDIEKILVLHINNIIYEINNMFRKEGSEADDLIGYFYGYSTYESLYKPLKKEKEEANRKEIVELFEQLCKNKRLSYLGIEIINPVTSGSSTIQIHQADKGKAQKRKNPTLKLEPKEFFYILKVLSQLRQDLTHGTPSKVIFRQNIQAPEKPKETAVLSGNMDDLLATLQQHFNSKAVAIKPKTVPTADLSVERVLTMLYRDRIKELNNNFVSKSAINLTLLFTIFGITEPEEKKAFVQAYYNFIVLKKYKHTGYSIKLLREHMANEIPEAGIIKSQIYDTVRSKLNPFLDFTIYRLYEEQDERALELIAQLRATGSEEEKEKIYSEEAQKLWPEIRDLVLNHILLQIKGARIGEIKRNNAIDPAIHPSMLDSGNVISTEAFFFCKLIYLMTIFLNGKEINDLLTSLIHQFKSIASFQQILKSEDMEWQVVGKYDIFNKSKEVTEQLTYINNFARMRQEDPFTKEIMFREAVEVLGYTVSESDMDQIAKEIMDPNISGEGSPNRNIRNFIINNVITSDRFLYLARYSNIKKVRQLAENSKLVRFVLKDIPDEQITRYYIACTGEKKAEYDQMREALAERISQLNFDSLKDVKQNGNEMDKQQKIAIVRLYLTVLYQVVKQLVYINARYFLAFHCLERDRILTDEEKWEKEYRNKGNKSKPEYAYKIFAEDFLKAHPPKGKPGNYLPLNFSHSDDWAISAFRNKVDHLDAIRNASEYIKDLKHIENWFGIYHYIIQRQLMDQYRYESTAESKLIPGTMVCEHIEPITEKYFGMAERYGTYCKDFVKALCVPFAYNLPRYKNLVVDGLFDKNKTGTSTDPMPEEA